MMLAMEAAENKLRATEITEDTEKNKKRDV